VFHIFKWGTWSHINYVVLKSFSKVLKGSNLEGQIKMTQTLFQSFKILIWDSNSNFSNPSLLVAWLCTPLKGPSLFVLLSSSINFWPSTLIMYALTNSSSSFPMELIGLELISQLVTIQNLLDNVLKTRGCPKHCNLYWIARPLPYTLEHCIEIKMTFVNNTCT